MDFIKSPSKINHRKRAPFLVGFILLLSDLIVILGSFYLAAQIRRGLIPYLGGVVFWPVYEPLVFLGMGYVALLFYFNDLYPGYGRTAVKEIEKTSKLLTMVFLFLGGTTYFLNAYEQFPRSIFILAWIICLVFLPLLRFFIRNRILKYSWYGIPVLFVTDGTESNSTLTALQNCRRMGWNPFGILSLDNDFQVLDNLFIPIISSWKTFLDIKKKHGINIAIFSAKPNQDNTRCLRQISEEFKIVTLVIPYYNLGSLWVTPRDLEGSLGLEVTYHLLDGLPKNIKRIIDVLGSILLIFILSPLLFVISLLIVIESSRPIFFQQERLGMNYKNFSVLKFRSMVNNAEEELKTFFENNPDARIEYNKYHKLSDDSRITKVGKILRKYSLDELPQLLNVLRGDMSLIGPRAYMPSELDEIGEYTEIILRVRPGMTGWWQVMGRHTTTFQARLKMDEYYISNWSLWMDLYISYKTFWVVIQGTGT